MPDNADSPQEIPTQAAELLEALLGVEAALKPLPSPPDTAMLVRYYGGVLSLAEARRVEEGLLIFEQARGLRRQVRETLRQAQSLSWAELSERAQGDGLIAEVARVRLELAVERVRTLSQRPARVEVPWEAIRREAAQGIREAQAALAAFQNFLTQVQFDVRHPRPAAAMGVATGEPRQTGALPSGVSGLSARAELGEDGELRVGVTLRAKNKAALRAVEGQNVWLALSLREEVREPLSSGSASAVAEAPVSARSLPDERWPLAVSPLQAGEAVLRVPAAAEMLGLDPDSFPFERLLVTMDVESLSSPSALRLLAILTDANGAPILRKGMPLKPEVVEFVGELRWEAGEFRAEAALSPITQAAYSDFSLILDLVLTPDAPQRLGAWPIAAWKKTETLLLVAPCPGSPDTAVSVASALRVTLQAPPA